MIDWQMMSAGADWQAAHDEVEAAFEASGLVVFRPERTSDASAAEFLGVRTDQILKRRTGGGGGDPSLPLYVIARFWPYVAQGGAATIGAAFAAGAIKVTRRAVRAVVEHLLRGRAGSVSIAIVQDDEPQHDLTFRFVKEDLFQSATTGDEHILQRIHTLLTDSQPDFEEQVLNLSRLLIDSLNASRLAADLALPSDSTGLERLQAWLQAKAYPHVDRDLEMLRSLYRTRSRGAAHKKGSDYTKMLQKAFGSSNRVEIIESLLAAATTMLADLERFFRLADV
jgi:hypothetical protein